MLQQSNRRNFLLALTLLSMGAAVFFGVKYYNVVNTEIIAGPADTTRCGPCMAYNNAKPKDAKIDLNLLKTMAFNYQNNVPASETRSVWFSLETLKKFIYQIESKSCNTCTGGLGIRIYYARYPSIVSPPAINNPFADLNGLDASYTNIHTIFMVPTIFKPDGYNHDFDPAGSSGCDPYNVKEYKNMSEDTLAIPTYTTSQFGTSVTALIAQNHGDACPPLPAGMTKCPDVGAFFNK